MQRTTTKGGRRVKYFYWFIKISSYMPSYKAFWVMVKYKYSHIQRSNRKFVAPNTYATNFPNFHVLLQNSSPQKLPNSKPKHSIYTCQNGLQNILEHREATSWPSANITTYTKVASHETFLGKRYSNANWASGRYLTLGQNCKFWH